MPPTLVNLATVCLGSRSTPGDCTDFPAGNAPTFQRHSHMESSQVHSNSDSKRTSWIGKGRQKAKWSNTHFIVTQKVISFSQDYVTVPDTLVASNLDRTSITTGAAVEHASANKTIKYSHILRSYDFVPVAIETLGAWSS